MSDVVVLGGCVVDLISYVEKFPKPGETMTGKQFQKGFGGKAANQCVMTKKLGAITSIIAKLGNDSFGSEYIHHLNESGINCDFASQTVLSHTSTASISVTDKGENAIIYVPGAVMYLKPDDILAAEEMIAKSKVLLCTYECPLDTLRTALEIAKKHNVKTVVNAAPVTNPSYESLYPLIDVICLNEIEAEETTQLPMKEVNDSDAIMQNLFKKGCSTVILTLGDKEVVFQCKSDSTYSYVAAENVKAVDTTGAGDAFMGSLVYYLSCHSHLNLKSAIQRSCTIATKSVLKKGTQTSFPNKEDISEDLFR